MRSGEEKTEPATPKKKKEVREKGQVAKSEDFNSSLIMLAGVLLIFSLGGVMVAQMEDTMRVLCGNLYYKNFTADTFQTLLLDISFKNMKGLLPVLGGFMVVGLIASYAQTGFAFSYKALMPNFKKLNPVSGIQRLVSKRSLMKLFMSMGKLCIMGGVSYLSVRKDLEPLMELTSMRMEVIFSSVSGLIFGITLKIGIILFILSLFDLLYQRWQYSRDMMMTKNEVKQETKQAEGDPQTKSRIRAVQRQMSNKRMMNAIPDADVVVTNPTHYAVALKYDAITMEAPKVIAKGADYLALKIREIAENNNIPIVEDSILARVLYSTTEIDEEIPPKLYQAVAKVLSYVYQLRNMVANQG
ncbi:MAG: flagellar biosynthesis protein FlhB [Candidatus Loosdrechtia sp.]|uniref:flagellar biosynthesis protein FlhB n=1 Tax=Candidatus Loosdrechtia sp. TaxID=3101272 RepID=UPI00403A7CBC